MARSMVKPTVKSIAKSMAQTRAGRTQSADGVMGRLRFGGAADAARGRVRVACAATTPAAR
jgi:hypothetical protein